MLTIYHLENSRSERIIWLVEELGLKYKLEKFPRVNGGAAPEYKALHALGRAPIIRDGDLTLIESGAIIEYILTRYGKGKLMPKVTAPEYPFYLQWLHFAEGSVLQHLIAVFLIDLGTQQGAPANPMREMLFRRLKEDLAFIDHTLAKQPYFAGNAFTGADINMVFALRFARDYMKLDLSEFPHIAPYWTRIAERPAFKKAMSLA